MKEFDFEVRFTNSAYIRQCSAPRPDQMKFNLIVDEDNEWQSCGYYGSIKECKERISEMGGGAWCFRRRNGEIISQGEVNGRNG